MTRAMARLRWLVVVLGAAVSGAALADTLRESKKLRRDLETELPSVEAAYRAAPGDPANRRAHADLLFQLGRMWAANDVIAPLAMVASTHVGDLSLGARLALMLGDYDRAERLFRRLGEVAEGGSDDHQKAVSGLALT